ncbi:MAG: LicD family protein [archaeon]|nr:LicD family protein [archaeon]
MNDLQKNLFQLLTEIDDICKKYDIEYYLAGGTALGTVRNHCFLPWDDDIDLYITRDNWNKLRHVLETEENVVPKGRSFIYNENTEYYCNPIPRYVDNTTTAIYKSQALAGKACGQHIELLIMDPIPNDEEERKEYIKLLRLYTELLSPYFIVNKNLPLNEWEKHYKLYKKYCKRVEKEGEKKVLKELEDKLQTFKTEECDTYCMRWGINILMYKKEYYGKGRVEVFEDKEFPVGEYAEKIFRVAYGDSWMYIPEGDGQIVHDALQDINVPFKEYTNRYLNKVNKESVFEKFKRNKQNNTSVFYNHEKMNMLVAKAKVQIESKKIYKDLKEKEDYLRLLLKNKDYKTLSYEFKEYCELQFDEDVRKYKIIVPISDKNLTTLLLNYIEQGKYYKANKYLNIRKMQDKSITEELIKIENMIKSCRELSIARYDEKDKELVQSLINKYENKYPNLLDIYRSKLWIEEDNAKCIEDYKKIDNSCDKILEMYPFDGEVMAIQAKAKLECNNREEAIELYKKAINNTRNGLIWQKVQYEIGISRIDIERDLIEGL